MENMPVLRCTMCAHGCPVTDPSCRKGQDFAAWLYSEEGQIWLRAQTSETVNANA